jgi:hypothetical protein
VSRTAFSREIETLLSKHAGKQCIPVDEPDLFCALRLEGDVAWCQSRSLTLYVLQNPVAGFGSIPNTMFEIDGGGILDRLPYGSSSSLASL